MQQYYHNQHKWSYDLIFLFFLTCITCPAPYNIQWGGGGGGALEASRGMETGQVASRAVPVPEPTVEQEVWAVMADQGFRAAMTEQGFRAAMAEQGAWAAMADSRIPWVSHERWQISRKPRARRAVDGGDFHAADGGKKKRKQKTFKKWKNKRGKEVTAHFLF